MSLNAWICRSSPRPPTLDELAANIREAISLHLEGEDLVELGLAPDPTILATMELQSVA
jgi:hypothetical protein